MAVPTAPLSSDDGIITRSITMTGGAGEKSGHQPIDQSRADSHSNCNLKHPG